MVLSTLRGFNNGKKKASSEVSFKKKKDTAQYKTINEKLFNIVHLQS